MTRIRRTAFFSAVEVLVNGIGMFVLVIVLYRAVGAQGIGVWSLVMAIVSLVRIADLGLTTGMIRFVARARAGGETEDPGGVVAAALILSALLHGLFAIVGYLPAHAILERLVSPDLRPVATNLLPVALLSIWLSSTSQILVSVVMGLHRSDLRSVFSVVGGLVLVAGTALLLPVLGLEGAVLAQIAQSLVVGVGLFFVIRREAPDVTRYRGRPRFGAVLAMIRGFGLPVQGGFIASLAVEPTTKAFLAALGPIEAVGYFEMANRVVQQARSVAVAPNLALTSAFADFDHRDRGAMRMLFRRAVDLTLLIGPLVVGAAVAGAPFLAQVWTGYAAPLFVVFLVVLSVGSLFNVLSAPALGLAYGLGEMRWPFLGQLTVTVLNGLLGGPLGHLFGVVGIVAGLALATAAGALVILVPVQRRAGVDLGGAMREGGAVVIASLVGAAAGLAGFWTTVGTLGTIPAGMLSGILFLACVALPMIRHPLFDKTFAGLRSRLVQR